jgi:putative transposase
MLAQPAVKLMVANRDKRSSKDYPTLPCVLSKSLLRKYQRNKKLRSVKNLVLPVCGDKGRQIKLEQGGFRVPAFFKKEVLPVVFPKPIIGFIRGAEFFKRDGQWFCSLSYNTPIENPRNFSTTLGVDRNSVGNVAAIACPETGVVRLLGPNAAKLKENYRNRKKNLQKAGKFSLLKKLNRKQSRRTRDINHKVSRAIVEHAKKHHSAIVLEDLQGIRKGKARRYVEKSQWAFYQLEQFLIYKSILSGVPLFYVNPRNTSKECSRCGSINIPNGKHYECSCGHVSHRDANAAFNIAQRFLRENGIPREFAVSPIGGAYATRGEPRANAALHVESSGGAR